MAESWQSTGVTDFAQYNAAQSPEIKATRSDGRVDRIALENLLAGTTAITFTYPDETARTAETGYPITTADISQNRLFLQEDTRSIWRATGTAGAVVWQVLSELAIEKWASLALADSPAAIAFDDRRILNFTGTAAIVATVDPLTDIITATGHALVDGNQVTISGDSNDYFVISSAPDTLQVSLTNGGAAVDFTTAFPADTRIGLISERMILDVNVGTGPDSSQEGIILLRSSPLTSWTTGFLRLRVTNGGAPVSVTTRNGVAADGVVDIDAQDIGDNRLAIVWDSTTSEVNLYTTTEGNSVPQIVYSNVAPDPNVSPIWMDTATDPTKTLPNFWDPVLTQWRQFVA